jgi:hypothetical protein
MKCPSPRLESFGISTISLLLFLTISTAQAIQPGFIGRNGDLKSSPFKGKVVSTNGNRVQLERSTVRGHRFEAIFTLTPNTTYEGGFLRDLVPGANVVMYYHLEGPNSDTAIAEKVRFKPRG